MPASQTTSAFFSSVSFQNSVVKAVGFGTQAESILPLGLATDVYVPPQGALILTVGVGKQFATIGAAVAAAHDDTVILVSAGTYTNDFAFISNKLTLVGVGGLVNMVATIPPPNLKGILTINNDTTIRNFSFTGAKIDDGYGGNGAGIRYEGGQLSLIDCNFTKNQNGIMGNPVSGRAINTVTIDHCEFTENGSGSGGTHNLYIGAVDSLVATNSVFATAVIGHDFKSRALSTRLENNLFFDGPNGTASYNIDLPNGGVAIVRNNIIEKGVNAPNNSMVHFGGEGIPYAGSSLLLEGNSFINDKGPSTTAVLNHTSISVDIIGNSFVRLSQLAIASGPATETNNVDAAGVKFPDSQLVGVLPGNTTVYTDAAPHSITFDRSDQAVQGGAGRITVTARAGHVIAMGGSGGMDYLETAASGGNTISTKAGSTNTVVLNGQDLVDSNGTDTITGGTGNLTGQLNGNATLLDTYGSSQWTVNGTATVTGRGTTSEGISIGAHGSLTAKGTTAFIHVQNNGGQFAYDLMQNGKHAQASFSGGAFDISIYDGWMQGTTTAGAVGSVIRLGDGDLQLTSLGNDTIYAGAGNASLIVSGSAKIYAGTGLLSVSARGIMNGVDVYGGSGNYVIGGDSGRITYHGGDLASSVQASVSNLTLLGGNGRMTIQGGARTTINGGSGGINLVEDTNSGANTITTALGSTNRLTLYGADVVKSWGNDTIAGGVGNQSIEMWGNATLNAGTGNSSIILRGNDVVNGSTGNNTITVTAGATATVKAAGWTNITQDAATTKLTSGTGTALTSATVTGKATLFADGTGAITITTNAGANDVNATSGLIYLTSNGADTIRTGASSDLITLNAANAEVWGGSGRVFITNNHWVEQDKVTLHGGSGSMQYNQGAAQMTFVGGSGDAMLRAQSGKLFITGGAGLVNVSAGNAAVQFVGGTGQSLLQMTGGGDITFGAGSTNIATLQAHASNIYRFGAGHGGGRDVITGFQAGVDKLQFQGVGVAAQTTSGGSTNLVLTDNTKLTLAGVTGLASMTHSGNSFTF